MVSLYVDDLLLYLSDPAKSVLHLLDYINAFGKISGYTINWSKSEFMSFARHTNPSQAGPLPNSQRPLYIHWHCGSKHPYKQIFKEHFKARIDKLKDNIERWRLLPLSMIGKINAIQMFTLPKLLCLFQNVTICMPVSFFKLVD